MQKIIASSKKAEDVVMLLHRHHVKHDFGFVAAAGPDFGCAKAWTTNAPGVFVVELRAVNATDKEVVYAFVGDIEYAEDLAVFLMPECDDLITEYVTMANVMGIDYTRKFTRCMQPYEAKMYCIFITTYRCHSEVGDHHRVTRAYDKDDSGIPATFQSYRDAQKAIPAIRESWPHDPPLFDDSKKPIITIIPITI